MSGQIHKTTIHTGSIEALEAVWGTLVTNAAAAASTAWPSANLGIFVPFKLSGSYTVNFVFWCNGATVGNGTACVAVYDTAASPARLLTCSATTTAGASIVQKVDITPVALSAGQYYMAISLSSATDTLLRWSTAQARYAAMSGCAQQASVGTLPNPATLATIPVFGIGNGPTI
jgi:hypothetical protein